ncbi:MAG TPA: DSD1 family PLP-dependent enzyme [Anaerolineae bacterium]|nr:DSD1 family PLP-dependent enzyme [Anaerolineae bacterium]HIQ05607.1 DSD1 family PLP-dependent enzyme [Anaerolineae bacterium]
MNNSLIGMTWEELDTPALCLDMTLVEQNIAKMAAYLVDRSAKLRPHTKTHKTPILAHKQIAAGAIGIICAKLGEAEVMATAGIRDILIANQIVGTHKIARLVNLAAYTDVMVAVDNAANVADLDAAAQAKGVRLRVLIEVDIGMGRCGVDPGEPTLALAHEIIASPGLRFEGLMGYEGHTVMIPDYAERKQQTEEGLGKLVATAELIRANGIPVSIVSSGGTGTYTITGNYPGITEIQAGSYATMDTQYRDVVGVTEFAAALTVLATVVSTPRPDVAIIDAGLKTMTQEFGLPVVARPDGWRLVSLSEEHGKLEREDGPKLHIGDKVVIWPSHGCTTINLHDEFFVLRDGVLEAIWSIAGRGKIR